MWIIWKVVLIVAHAVSIRIRIARISPKIQHLIAVTQCVVVRIRIEGVGATAPLGHTDLSTVQQPITVRIRIVRISAVDEFGVVAEAVSINIPTRDDFESIIPSIAVFIGYHK